jgi:hypothetical protein
MATSSVPTFQIQFHAPFFVSFFCLCDIMSVVEHLSSHLRLMHTKCANSKGPTINPYKAAMLLIVLFFMLPTDSPLLVKGRWAFAIKE